MKKLIAFLSKYTIAGIIIIACLMILFKGKGKEEGVKSVEIAPVNVTTIKVKRETFNVYEDTIGIVYNFEANQISSEVAARVLKVNVKLGDHVKKGQVLAVLDPSEYINSADAEKAEIKRINAVLADQKLTLSRYKKLIKKGFISQAEVDSAKADVDSSLASLKNAKALLANYQIKIEKSSIINDKDGIVQDVQIAKGDFANIGTELFSVVDNTHLNVIVGLPESFLPKLHQGAEVLLTIPGRETPVKSTIKELKPIIDETSRSVQVVIDVNNSKLHLKPGGTLPVSVLLEKKVNAMVLPEESIVERMAGDVVYLVNPDNKTVTEKPIKAGVNKSGTVEIVSGLSVNDTVVLSGAGFLSDKAKIIINDAN
ncbi:Multidrug resistance protein MdtA [Candidatus Hepatincola sp. Pdp]